ncbi:MAG: helix-turn-helix transcriptional regulator, partial [Pseudomonadota bacterium]|nr:helix-turn-helix transcriptional regulator [Pseudomonadota bacterium]
TYAMPLPPGVDIEKFQENISIGLDKRVFHRLYFVERKTDCYATWGFGVLTEPKSIFNFYLNSLEMLGRFIEYFEYHAQELIAENAQKNRIIMPKYFDKLPQPNQREDFCLPSSVLDFAVDPPKKARQFNISLTPREMECLTLIARGYTMKSVAQNLEISPRTVEMHLRNIKDKHGLSSKNQLVDIWHECYSKA